MRDAAADITAISDHLKKLNEYCILYVYYNITAVYSGNFVMIDLETTTQRVNFQLAVQYSLLISHISFTVSINSFLNHLKF